MNFAKEKADELYNKYYQLSADSSYPENMAKQCALIALDELIKEQTMWQNGEVNPVLYWQQVKIEIEKL